MALMSLLYIAANGMKVLGYALFKKISWIRKGVVMFSRGKRFLFLALAAGVLIFFGWSCNKYPNKAGISDNQLVATVGDQKITFKDWMMHLDLLRVFSPQPVDPNSAEQVKEVLESLINQEVVLGVIHKTSYSDPKFEEMAQKELVEAGLQIKELKDKLTRDIETVNRLEKNYKDGYMQMLMAQHYAASQVDSVVVSDQEAKDKYMELSKQAKLAGQQVPAFDRIEDQLKLRIRADKLLTKLQGDRKINRQVDVIEKYLANLTSEQQSLQAPVQPGAGGAPSRGKGMNPRAKQ